MQPGASLARLVHWRWAPCLALAIGATVFALSAAAFIPESLDGSTTPNDDTSEGSESAAPQGADDATAATTVTSRARARAARGATGGRSTPRAPGGAVKSIFHSTPSPELPVAPPDPEPEPPPPPPPLPPPTSTTFTLPEPPPPPVPEPAAAADSTQAAPAE